MRLIVLTILTLVLSFTLFVSPANAQSKKELAAQNAALAARVQNLENRLLTGDPAAERLMQRIDSLETAQRSQTGELERLRFERDTLRAEVKALSEDLLAIQDLLDRTRIHLDAVDMVAQNNAPRVYGETLPQDYMPPNPGPQPDSGLNGFEQPVTPNNQVGDQVSNQPSQVPSAPVFKEQTLPAQEEFQQLAQLPDQGKQLLAEGDYTGAQSAFARYLGQNPDAPNAGEVSFWLGETHFVKGGYADAATAFLESLRKDPNGAKGPDAMIRLAASLRELGNIEEACQTLDSFPAQYPRADASLREKARVETVRTGC